MRGTSLFAAVGWLAVAGSSCTGRNPAYRGLTHADGATSTDPEAADAGHAAPADARPADQRASEATAVDAAARADVATPLDAAMPPDLALLRKIPNLLGYWRFEDGPTTRQITDSSGNNRHGTLRGVSPASASGEGRKGLGLVLPTGAPIAEAGVEIPWDTTINAMTSFTISVWLKRSVVSPAVHRSVISRQLTDDFEVFNLSCNDDELIIYIPGEGSQVNREARALRAAPAQVWIHAVATYDGGWLRLYVNGQDPVEKEFANRLKPSQMPIFIGTNKNANHTEPFEGTIDEVALYDVALGRAEVDKLYKRATPWDSLSAGRWRP